MRKTFIAFALAAGAVVAPALADVLSMPAEPTVVSTTAPVRGESMAEVRRQFGEPSVKHPTVGGASRQQPPINRWDYPSFSIVFERDKVIDIVIPDAPMPVQTNKDALAPATP